MDGLDDQAQAVLQSIIEQLYTLDAVQVKHSSRDLIILGVTQAMKDTTSSRPIVARKLILRSGISFQAIGWLQEALLISSSFHNIQELEVCSLQDISVLEKTFECCHKCGITKLTLNSFLSYARGRHDMVTQTIRSGLIMNEYGGDEDTPNQPEIEDENAHQPAPQQQLAFYDVMSGQRGITDRISRTTISSESNNNSTSDKASYSCLEYLELHNYPIGVKGTQILASFPVCTANLVTLKLLDCDIRSDSANYLAQLIQYSGKLQTLDLSHNRQFRSKLTREMTIKTIIQRGLKDNLSLLQLHLNGVDKDINRKKLDRHLDINRLLLSYRKHAEQNVFGIHPAIWCDLLARVSVKPAALYFFLQQNITTIFA